MIPRYNFYWAFDKFYEDPKGEYIKAKDILPILKAAGLLDKAPCIMCGYNGPLYFQHNCFKGEL
jgi:hypothetical protein